MEKNQGYSLIEALIVVTLLALVAMTSTTFLFASLSGSGKASGLAVVKQNGDHASGILERTLRFAHTVDCQDLGFGIDQLDVIPERGADLTTFRVINDSGVDRVAMETDAGATLTYLTSVRLQASAFDCQLEVPTYSPGFAPDSVFVSFRLELDPGSGRPEEVTGETFETRVLLRDY